MWEHITSGSWPRSEQLQVYYSEAGELLVVELVTVADAVTGVMVLVEVRSALAELAVPDVIAEVVIEVADCGTVEEAEPLVGAPLPVIFAPPSHALTMLYSMLRA